VTTRIVGWLALLDPFDPSASNGERQLCSAAIAVL